MVYDFREVDKIAILVTLLLQFSTAFILWIARLGHRFRCEY